MLTLLIILFAVDPVATSASQSVRLTATGDNAPAIQAFIDALPNGATIKIPAGVWHVESRLKLKAQQKLVGAGMDRTTIKSRGADWSGPIVAWGVDWLNPADGVELRDLTIEQAVVGTSKHGCILGEGNDSKLTRIRVVGSRYEGIIIGGWNKNATLTDCEAIDCGNGGPAYTQSTSGFNAHAFNTRYIRCRAKRCGQGFEFGATGTIVDGCIASDPGPGTPSMAYNCGSSVNGVWKVRLLRSRSFGYVDAVLIGNGIGRLSDVRVEGCTFVGGSLNFHGGQPTNFARHPFPGFEGPDTHGSAVVGNTFIFHRPNHGALSYYGGPAAAHAVFGREPLKVERNTIHYRLAAGDVQSAPPIGFAGSIVAKCTAAGNVISGLDEAPVRGDVATFSVNDNPAVPNMPLTSKGNAAFRADGAERAVVERREGETK